MIAPKNPDELLVTLIRIFQINPKNIQVNGILCFRVSLGAPSMIVNDRYADLVHSWTLTLLKGQIKQCSRHPVAMDDSMCVKAYPPGEG